MSEAITLLNSLCAGPECTRLSKTHGLCASHRSQLSRGGVLKPLLLPRSPIEYFSSHIVVRDDDCWHWVGPVDGFRLGEEPIEGGYGRLRAGGIAPMAHRWAYEHYAKVRLTPEDTIDHRCRNTRCCNPEHLEIVSRSENLERANLYNQLRSENQRLRGYIQKHGFDPDEVLWPKEQIAS